jgi:hypothetical protein
VDVDHRLAAAAAASRRAGNFTRNRGASTMTDAAKPRRLTTPRKNARPVTGPEQAAAPAVSPAAGKPRLHDPIDADNLDDAFFKALQEDFIINGHSVIEAMRAEKPTEYIKIIATLRTKGAENAIDPLREMSDVDLEREIHARAAAAGYEIRRVVSPRREEGDG